eukprot:32370-Eustigmatos_ZCMA.PRE.1
MSTSSAPDAAAEIARLLRTSSDVRHGSRGETRIYKEDEGVKRLIDLSFGGLHKCKKDILYDFFKTAFDGSGACSAHLPTTSVLTRRSLTCALVCRRHSCLTMPSPLTQVATTSLTRAVALTGEWLSHQVLSRPAVTL